jgi:hypothetical protein
MKYVKQLSIGAIAAMAVLAMTASSASATELYSGLTTLKAGTVISATLSGTATLTTTEGTVLVKCTGGSIAGKTSNTGSSTETVKGTVAAADLTWSNCSEPTSTLAGGNLEIHHAGVGINGTLTGSGFEVTVDTTVFGSCVFTLAAGTDLGTLTGSTSSNATMDINAAVTRKSGLCPGTERWVATYTVTSPTTLHVTTS